MHRPRLLDHLTPAAPAPEAGDRPIVPDLAKLRTTPRFRSLMKSYQALMGAGEDFAKAQVDVRAHQSHSKTGKVFNVQQHTMTVDKKAVVDGVAQALKAKPGTGKAPRAIDAAAAGGKDPAKVLMKHRKAGAVQLYGNKQMAEQAARGIKGAAVHEHGGSYVVATREASRELSAAGVPKAGKGAQADFPDVNQMAPDHLIQAGQATLAHLRTLPPGSPEHAHVNTQFEAIRKMIQSWNKSKGKSADADFPMPEAPAWAGGEAKLTSPKQFELAASMASSKEEAFELGHYLNALRAKNGYTGPEWDSAWAEVKHAIARNPSSALQGVLADKRKNKAKLDAEFQKLTAAAEEKRAKAENFGQAAADAADAAKPALDPKAKKATSAKKQHRKADAEAKAAEQAAAQHGEKVQQADSELADLHIAGGMHPDNLGTPSANTHFVSGGRAIPGAGGKGGAAGKGGAKGKPGGKPAKPGQPPAGAPGGSGPALMVPVRGPKGPGETTTPDSVLAPPVMPDHLGRSAAKTRGGTKADKPGAKAEKPTSAAAKQDKFDDLTDQGHIETFGSMDAVDRHRERNPQSENTHPHVFVDPSTDGGEPFYHVASDEGAEHLKAMGMKQLGVEPKKPSKLVSGSQKAREQRRKEMVDRGMDPWAPLSKRRDGQLWQPGYKPGTGTPRTHTGAMPLEPPDGYEPPDHTSPTPPESAGGDEGGQAEKPSPKQPKPKKPAIADEADEQPAGGEPAGDGEKADEDKPGEGEAPKADDPKAGDAAGGGKPGGEDKPGGDRPRRGWAQPAPKPSRKPKQPSAHAEDGSHGDRRHAKTHGGLSPSKLARGVRDILSQIMSEERGENLHGGTRA